MNDEVEILPNVVVIFLMELKALLSFSVELLFLDIADKTEVFHIFNSLRFLISKLRKRINDDTENNVEQDCNNDHKEWQIINGSEVEPLNVLRSCGLSWEEITNTTSTSQTVVEGGEEAMHHWHADTVSFCVQDTAMDHVFVIGVIQENEPNNRVNVNDHNSKHGCHEQLVPIQRHTFNNILQLREPVLYYNN